MPLIPVHRDDSTAAFFDGTANGEFLIVRNTQTGEFFDPKFDIDLSPSLFERVPAAGGGKVVSWSVVHSRVDDNENTRVVGIVELDEGPWWWTELLGADPSTDLRDARVLLSFAPSGSGPDDETLPIWTIA